MSGSGIAEEPSAAVSTPERNERDAMLVIIDLLKNGIPAKDTKLPQPLMKILEVKDLITSLGKAAFSEKDSATIVAVLKKEQELIDMTVKKKSIEELQGTNRNKGPQPNKEVMDL